MPDPATIYSEAKFRAALDVVQCNPDVVDTLGKPTVAAIKAALVIAANEAALDAAEVADDPDPDPASSGALALGG